MRANIYFYLATTIISLVIIPTTGSPIQNATSKIPQDIIEKRKAPTTTNHTIVDLIGQQTETVKKIVANHSQQVSAIDYPLVTKLEPDYSAEAKRQIEKMSIEELRIKCQQLSKLLQINETKTPLNYNGINSYQNTPVKPSNHKPYDAQRPVYIQPKVTYKPKYTTPKPNGFYITQKPSISTQTPPVKFIRLEPVILQKTILGDGRTVYFWHKSLPTAVEIANDATSNTDQSTSPDQNQGYSSSSYNNYYGQPPIYGSPYGYGNTPYQYLPMPQSQNNYAQKAYISPHQTVYSSSSVEDNPVEEVKSTEIITESTSTSTTEQSSYGYGFGSFLPFYSYRQDVATTSTTTEPTTTTTTPEPTTRKPKPEDLLYAQQIKFIVPVPYEGFAGGNRPSVRNPWEFDQYAYYPKELQPSTVNVQVPYNPTFHMIRAIAVPNTVNKLNDESNISS